MFATPPMTQAVRVAKAALSGRIASNVVENVAFIRTDCHVARVGPTTPKQADPMLLRSIRPKHATYRDLSPDNGSSGRT
jgi:hypothetical protein